MRGRIVFLLSAGLALCAGSASEGRSDPYQCRAQVRTALGIPPYQGHLVPGFWAKVHECIYKAEHPDRNGHASAKSPVGRMNKTPTPAAQKTELPGSKVNVTVIAAPASSSPSSTSESSQINQLKQVTNDLEGQTKLLTTLLAELKADRSRNEGPSDLVEQSLKLVEKKLSIVEMQRSSTIPQHPQSEAAIRPNDQMSYPTARAISENYPLVQYYISGTKEGGDIWVLPTVSDGGQLQFKMRFLDSDAPTDKVRSEAVLDQAQVARMAAGLAKLYRWSQIAHRERIRREYQKQAECFPASDCPKGDERIDGKSSIELLFHVNDEGATNGVFRRNKGQYVENFSLSMESIAMLWCYMQHVIKEGDLEYKAGLQTKENLDQLFQ